eukprot:1116422-Rhodomonas_salina.1
MKDVKLIKDLQDELAEKRRTTLNSLDLVRELRGQVEALQAMASCFRTKRGIWRHRCRLAKQRLRVQINHPGTNQIVATDSDLEPVTPNVEDGDDVGGADPALEDVMLAPHRF